MAHTLSSFWQGLAEARCAAALARWWAGQRRGGSEKVAAEAVVVEEELMILKGLHMNIQFGKCPNMEEKYSHNCNNVPCIIYSAMEKQP